MILYDSFKILSHITDIFAQIPRSPLGLIKPHPCLFLEMPQSIPVSMRRIFTSRLVSHGCAERSSAITPETTGVAMEVPLRLLYALP